MNPAYPVYTVTAGVVTPGAQVEMFSLKNVSVAIPAVLVGDKKKGVIPIFLSPTEESSLKEGKEVVVTSVSLSTTTRGFPKFVSVGYPTDTDQIVVVFRTPTGENGYNKHTGDRSGWKCKKCQATEQERDIPSSCPGCGALVTKCFLNLPGKTLVSGCVSSRGQQLIALIPKNEVFRTFYAREMNGCFSHYYCWDGDQLLSSTWEERQEQRLF